MVVKEFQQIRRDPRALGILLLFPTALLAFLGTIISMDVKYVKVMVLDEDRSDLSRQLIGNVTRYEHFELAGSVDSPAKLAQCLHDGTARIGLHVPRGFARDIRQGGRPTVQAVVDGTNSLIASSSAGTLRAYVNACSMQYMSKYTPVRNASIPARGTAWPGTTAPTLTASVGEAGQAPAPEVPFPVLSGIGFASQALHASRPAVVMPRIRMYYNPELRSSFFLIPGLVAFILAVANALATALSIVREKERGTIEQITLSPLRAWAFITGKIIPYVIISLVSAVSILAAGNIMFGVPVRGNMAFLGIATLVYVLSTLGMGLLISSITSSQQVAFTLAAIATMLPTFVLSGFVFPIRNMPVIIQLITYMVPARYYIRILRATLLMGADPAVLLPDMGGLLAVAAFMMVVAIIRIHRGGLRT